MVVTGTRRVLWRGRVPPEALRPAQEGHLGSIAESSVKAKSKRSSILNQAPL